MSNKDEQAFPQFQDLGATGGLTKREYAAIQIMAGSSGNPDFVCSAAELAKVAVESADALFEELSK